MFACPTRRLSRPPFATPRRPGRLCNAPLVLSLLMVCTWPASAAGAARDFEAHGSDERLWLARVEPPPAGKPDEKVTVLFVREKFAPEWRRLPALQMRLAGLAS